MPAVAARLRGILGKALQQRLDPDQVVALGAAAQAGLIAKEQVLADLVVTDVAPFTLGINVSRQFGTEHGEGYLLPIIQRNTTIPVSRVQSLLAMMRLLSSAPPTRYHGKGCTPLPREKS